MSSGTEMSAPEQKLPPEPVITSARTPRSRPAALSASRNAIHSSGLIAFLRRGRLSVSVRTPSQSFDSSTGPSVAVINGERTSHHHAAVHGQHLPGDVGRGIGGEKNEST